MSPAKRVSTPADDEEGVFVPEFLLQHKGLRKDYEVSLRQLEHALDSPEQFHAFVDDLETRDAAWLPHKPVKGWKKARQHIKHFLKAFSSLYFQPSEEPYNLLNVFLQSFSMIILRKLLKNAGFRLIIVAIPEIPDHYPHTSVPDHAPRLVAEGKWQQAPKKGVVFDRSDAKLFIEALENPDHALRSAAEQAMRVFTRAAQRAGVITSDSSSQEFNVRNIYEVVPTLRQAAENSGVPVEEIMSIRDIQAEWDITRDRLQQLMRRERKNSPHLTPLSVRLQGFGDQLLFRRSEVERTLADPKLAVTKKPEQPKTQPLDSAQSSEVVPTLRQASEKTGLPLNEIMTTRDILAEFGVNRSRINRWIQSPQGQPRLTPLPFKLEGGGIGGQYLFRRSDIERILADPPKGGRPRK
jgi:hypothetical protein